MKKPILAIATAFFLAVLFCNAADAANGDDCRARTGACSTSCISGGFLGYYDCPQNAPMCCGDPAEANKKIFGEGGLNPFSTGTAGQSTDSGQRTGAITNPISANSFGELFQRAMNYFRTIAGTIAVLFIVIGGVMYMTSGANKAVTDRARKTIVFAIIGLVIVVAAPLFLSDILMVLKGTSGRSALLAVATNVLRILLASVGVFAIIGLLNGAVIMFIASGDQKTIEMGRTHVKYSLIAIAMSAGSLVILRAFAEMILGKSVAP